MEGSDTGWAPAFHSYKDIIPRHESTVYASFGDNLTVALRMYNRAYNMQVQSPKLL